MIALLVAFCLSLWSLISPGYPRAGAAREIAEASSSAVLEDGAEAPVYTSHAEDLAALAYTAVRESSLRTDKGGDCTDPNDERTCRAHGPWQLHGDCGLRSLVEQARCELAILRSGKSSCPEHPMAALWGAARCHGIDPLRGGDVELLAAKRERRVRALLERVLAGSP